MDTGYIAFLADEALTEELFEVDADDLVEWQALIQRIEKSGRLRWGNSTDGLAWEVLKDYIEEKVGYREYEGDLDFDESIGEFVSWVVHAEAFEDAASALSRLQPERDPDFNDAIYAQLNALGLEPGEREEQKARSLAIFKDLVKTLQAEPHDKNLVVLVPF